MSVEVYDPFPGDDGIFENCSCCREPTEFWFKKNDVALCKKCAIFVSEEDIPSKLDWILKEELMDLLTKSQKELS